MHHLIISAGMTKSEAFLSALAIPLCVFIALSVLLFRAKKDKFYPAMPVVTAGCMAGLGMTIGIAALL
jgi:FtsH-binding integral membrane protein